jgi:hypothetical protein
MNYTISHSKYAGGKAYQLKICNRGKLKEEYNGDAAEFCLELSDHIVGFD